MTIAKGVLGCGTAAAVGSSTDAGAGVRYHLHIFSQLECSRQLQRGLEDLTSTHRPQRARVAVCPQLVFRQARCWLLIL
jgi:hypothetical protein